MINYSLEDLAKAKSELEVLNERWSNYAGNNPNKYYSQIESARAKVHRIETELKECGLIMRSPLEVRDAALDAAYPNAKSKEIVHWQDGKYMRRFSPISKSRSGKTVYAWRKYWEEVEG